MKSWRLLDHTADLRIEGRGATRKEALEALLEGLVRELDSGSGAVGETRRIRYAGVDLADTVVGVLGEVLWLVNGERWLPRACRVTALSDTLAGVECRGAPLAPDAHGLSEIKAATFHDFEFAEEEGGFAVRVVFDV